MSGLTVTMSTVDYLGPLAVDAQATDPWKTHGGRTSPALFELRLWCIVLMYLFETLQIRVLRPQVETLSKIPGCGVNLIPKVFGRVFQLRP